MFSSFLFWSKEILWWLKTKQEKENEIPIWSFLMVTQYSF